ncbi:Na+-transporting methylmalonyl-CoA/oxaloacetate decarboxylase gamma subunit [Sporomusaceae bacterium BoRhaA]|uniref:OadG family transporter subunit n=1 Tax=Pelorhabdus rhamnosifermentans TaxID=2772457 RepID=UPI001C05F1EC|nr:OadG family transporter subunit [Pelorhabdus rhamnosifermentans]MBU2699770.1 Na+-transporting methylmalonyl-CoA/oxaloacetate decarboxylase gamma subunit [Pelorhabdus rhamnosifermentans]
MMMWFIVFLIAVIILCYVAKVAQEAKDAKEEKNKPREAQAAVQTSSVSVPQPVAHTATQDDDELIAVISAAIAAISGSTSVQILSIRNGGKSWTMTGRQEVMGLFTNQM